MATLIGLIFIAGVVAIIFWPLGHEAEVAERIALGATDNLFDGIPSNVVRQFVDDVEPDVRHQARATLAARGEPV